MVDWLCWVSTTLHRHMYVGEGIGLRPAVAQQVAACLESEWWALARRIGGLDSTTQHELAHAQSSRGVSFIFDPTAHVIDDTLQGLTLTAIKQWASIYKKRSTLLALIYLLVGAVSRADAHVHMPHGLDQGIEVDLGVQ